MKAPTGPAGLARLVLVTLTALLAGACGRQPPTPPTPPSLEGQRVMLLPVRVGEPEALNAELGYWLTERAPATEWVLPDELQRALDRAPAWRVRLSTLPRDITQSPGRGPQLVDPTYGALRRLGAVVDATLALMPVTARQVGDPGAPVLELTAAVVDIRGGRVLWVLAVHAPVDPAAPHAAPAAVAEALARALFPQ
jgi:hypothetical protein